jgi:hypothetical protein
MADDDAHGRSARELLTRLRGRRAAVIERMAASSLEGPEWLHLVAQLRGVQDALELVKLAQTEGGEYRPSYHGEG